jgi:hypothetical protein
MDQAVVLAGQHAEWVNRLPECEDVVKLKHVSAAALRLLSWWCSVMNFLAGNAPAATIVSAKKAKNVAYADAVTLVDTYCALGATWRKELMRTARYKREKKTSFIQDEANALRRQAIALKRQLTAAKKGPKTKTTAKSGRPPRFDIAAARQLIMAVAGGDGVPSAKKKGGSSGSGGSSAVVRAPPVRGAAPTAKPAKVVAPVYMQPAMSDMCGVAFEHVLRLIKREDRSSGTMATSACLGVLDSTDGKVRRKARRRLNTAVNCHSHFLLQAVIMMCVLDPSRRLEIYCDIGTVTETSAGREVFTPLDKATVDLYARKRIVDDEFA